MPHKLFSAQQQSTPLRHYKSLWNCSAHSFSPYSESKTQKKCPTKPSRLCLHYFDSSSSCSPPPLQLCPPQTHFSILEHIRQLSLKGCWSGWSQIHNHTLTASSVSSDLSSKASHLKLRLVFLLQVLCFSHSTYDFLTSMFHLFMMHTFL